MDSAILVLATLAYPLAGGTLALLGLFAGPKRWRTNVFCLAFLIAIFSYNYRPDIVDLSPSTDLTRYFDYLASLRGDNFLQTISAPYISAHLYTFQIFAWICNALSDEQLLPFMSAFIVYWCGLYCTCYVGISMRAKWRYVRIYLLMQLIFLDWYSITNNIRNVCAFAMVGYAFFRDAYQNKKDVFTGICYIAPMFLHPTAMLILAFRIAFAFLKSPCAQLSLFLLVLSSNGIISYVYAHIQMITSNEMVLSLVRKSYAYIEDTSSAYGTAVSKSLPSLIIRILYLSIVAIFCIIEIRRLFSKNAGFHEKIFPANFRFNFCPLIFGAFALSCATMLVPGYWRFSAAVILFGGCIVIPFLKDSPSLSLISTLNMSLVIKLSFICLASFSCMRTAFQWIGRLYFPPFLYGVLTSSPFVYVLRAIFRFH